MIHITTRS